MQDAIIVNIENVKFAANQNFAGIIKKLLQGFMVLSSLQIKVTLLKVREAGKFLLL